MWRLGNNSKSKAYVESRAMAVYPYRKTTESPESWDRGRRVLQHGYSLGNRSEVQQGQ
jgi:hypothetical protein